MQSILRHKFTRTLFVIFIAAVLASVLSLPAGVNVAVAAPASDIPSSKAFTVTKKAENADTETVLGEYDTFFETIENMDINDAASLYTVYVNKDMVIPATEKLHGRSNNKIRLTSGKGGPYTLERRGPKDLISLMSNSELTIDNITLDGHGESRCFSVLSGAKASIGKGATIQNFTDVPGYDGPAIHVSNGGTLTIEAGAVIKNNTSAKQQGGAIQARQDATLIINGGLFENNIAASQGGAIAAYGKLKIAGGTFKGNKAKKVGGAIILGKTHPATIENAIFAENQASTGGAIYSSQEITLKNTSFNQNLANWGGAVFSVKPLSISGSTFNQNVANGAGGALYLNKNAGSAAITDSKFLQNSAGNGGAIYTYKFDNADPVANADAYKNISTDTRTLFQGNIAKDGAYTPPENFADYTKLLFSSDSDVAQKSVYRKSLLNNSDINYKNTHFYVNFINDGSLYAATKVEPGKSISGDALVEEKMPQNPSKDGYTFKEWNTQADGNGSAFTEETAVDSDMSVYAIYTKNPVPPAPPKKPAQRLPQTGESNSLGILLAALGFSISGFAVLRKQGALKRNK